MDNNDVNTMKKQIIGVTCAIMTLTSCATYQPETNSYSDPLAGFNRTMFSFNYNVLDPYILRPVASTWRDYMPKPFRTGIANASSNLGEPASFVNAIIQGEAKLAAVHFTRFFLNSIFGLAGFIDVAGMADPQLQKGNAQTFGSTLGHYGVPYGPYVVLPFYGQATLREDVGGMVDYLYPPLNWLDGWGVVRFVFDGIEARAVAIDYEDMLNNSDDPYSFLRNAYFQRKDFIASGGKINEARQEQRQETINEYIQDIDTQ